MPNPEFPFERARVKGKLTGYTMGAVCRICAIPVRPPSFATSCSKSVVKVARSRLCGNEIWRDIGSFEQK